MAETVDLRVNQDASFDLTFVYGDPPVDVTGYLALMQLRTAPGCILLLELTSSSGINVGSTDGTFAVSMTPEQTALLTQDCHYDLLVTDTEGHRIRVVEGTVAVDPAISQPPAFRQAQVVVFGRETSDAFGSAAIDTVTPTGHSFEAFPIPFPVNPGAGLWFGAATPDGEFPVGQMVLTDNEAHSTALGTSAYLFDPAARALENIAVPTTTGDLHPPGTNGATGSTLDMVVPVTIGGVEYIFAIGAVSYEGWQISVYGDAYWLMAFKKTAGSWAFDPSKSKTAAQLAASSSAGASAFPTTTNAFSETIHESLGPVCMGVAPVSGHLLIGNYFYASGLNSGSLVAIDPASGIVTAFHQFPDITDTNSVPTSFSVRDLCVNPTSLAGDERMILTFDVFVRSGGANYGLHPLMELAYNGTAFTQKSPPISPYSMPNMGYQNDFNIVGFDGDGNLWCPTNGGLGLSQFHGQEMHTFMASGANIPTFEDGGSSTVFPTFVKGDFRFGGFSITQGFSCSMNWDDANGRMTLLTLGGSVVAASLNDSLALGPELAVNGGLTSGTTGWNGFFTSTLTATTDADFASGHCLVLTSTAGANNIASQAGVPVTAFQNYILTAKVKGVTVPEGVTAELWWHDANGNLINSTHSSLVTMVSTGIMSVEHLVEAPPDAVSAFLLFNFTASGAGEQYKIGDVSWKTAPAKMTAVVDTNKARVIAGVGGPVFPNKGQIIDGRLYFTMLDLEESYPADVGEVLPQWLASVDLAALVTPTTPGVSVPSVPNLTSISGGDMQATVIWEPPANTGGTPILSYTINYSTTTETETPLVTGISPNATSYTVTGLANVDGFFTVTAVNAVGSSLPSNERSVTPAPVLPGAAVLNVTPGNTQNTLDWNDPTTGAPFSAVQVFSGPSAGALTLQTTLGVARTFPDTGLTNGTARFYGVKYVNSSGTGPMSNVVSATPTGSTQVAPPAVTGLAASGTGTTRTATWTLNGSVGTHNETDGVDYYVNGTKIGFEGYPAAAPTSHPFTGLATGSNVLGIVPYNGAGDGPMTTVTVVVAVQPPPPPPPPGSIIEGLFVSNQQVGSMQSLASSLGMPIKGYSFYTTGDTWNSITSWSPPSIPAGGAILLGVNLCPTTAPTGLSTVAANAHLFANLANNLLAATNAGHLVIIRLGYEMDGNWFAYSVGSGNANGNTPGQFAPAAHAVIQAMKAANPALKFDFCGNSGSSTLAQLEVLFGTTGPTDWDYVGGDHYQPNGATASIGFGAMGPNVALAVKYGKPVSCGEWGLNHADVPGFINDGAQFFNSPAAAVSKYGWQGTYGFSTYTVGYWSYFDQAATYGSDLESHPNSFNAFKADFG